MKVLFLSDWESEGGGAIAASRLASSLCARGHTVVRVVWHADHEPHAWQTDVPGQPQPLTFPVLRRLSLPVAFQNRLNIFNWLRHGQRWLERHQPDIINVHNIHSSPIPLGVLSHCAAVAPTVWTLHDMWSFTGRCAYNYDCQRFLTGCSAECPTPHEHPTLAPARIGPAWQARQRLLASLPDLTAVAPSRWLAEQAQAGLWRNHRIRHIPSGVPLHIYRPIERSLARAALAIPKDASVLLTAAQSLLERRKGVNLLLAALQGLTVRPLTLLTLGHGRLDVSLPGVCILRLGYIDNQRVQALAYSAADILVHPAPVDNLPNVVLESLACGTPVVAFPIGGLPDMVRPGQTGWLAESLRPEALTVVLDQAINELREGKDLRARCRTIAETEYAEDLQAARYEDLYRSLQRTGWKAAA